MAKRYRFAANEGEYGEPRRLHAIARHIRLTTKRDGRRFRWEKPNGHQSRRYVGVVAFTLQAARYLRKTSAGDLSKFQTRVDTDKPAARYHVKTERYIRETAGERVVKWALRQLGTPYRFGAQNGPDDAGPDTFDCSGFTAEGWSTEGVYLPHSAEMQREAGNVTLFYSMSQAQPGDLVFMNFPNSRRIYPPHASHVGFFLKPGFMVDTRNPVNEPVAVRAIDPAHVVAYGRLSVTRPLP